MAKRQLSVEVDAKLTVSNETAERCLKLLEMWQADHPDLFIVGEKLFSESGRRIVFRIKRSDSISK